MSIKRRNLRYSYKLKDRLKLKTRFKLWLKKLKLDIERLFYKLRIRGNNFFSFLYIMLILSILALSVGSALIFNVIRASLVEKHDEANKGFTKKNITVHYGNIDIEATVSGGILKEMIEDLNIVIDQDDEIYPDLSTPLEFVSECFIIIVDREIVTKTLQTDFETIENITEDTKDVKSKVVRHGEKGEVLLEIELVYKNGLLFSQTTLEKKVLKKPVDEIIEIYKTND